MKKTVECLMETSFEKEAVLRCDCGCEILTIGILEYEWFINFYGPCDYYNKVTHVNFTFKNFEDVKVFASICEDVNDRAGHQFMDMDYDIAPSYVLVMRDEYGYLNISKYNELEGEKKPKCLWEVCLSSRTTEKLSSLLKEWINEYEDYYKNFAEEIPY